MSDLKDESVRVAEVRASAPTPSGVPLIHIVLALVTLLALTAVALAAAALGISLKHAAPAPSPPTLPYSLKLTTLVVTQGAPRLILRPVAEGQAGVGDFLEYAAPLSIDGKAAGYLIGRFVTSILVNESISIIPDLADNDRAFDVRMVTIVLRLTGGQISIFGQSRYPGGAGSLLRINRAFVRPIVGGTGTYFAVSGEMLTVRNEDNTYTHTLLFVQPLVNGVDPANVNLKV